MKTIYPFRRILFIITVTLVFFAFTSVNRTQQDNLQFHSSYKGYSTLTDNYPIEAGPTLSPDVTLTPFINNFINLTSNNY